MPMQRYVPGPDDLVLGQWWAHLQETGDLAPMLPAAHQSLYGFLAFFQAPTTLLVESDAAGMWVAVWVRPWLDGAWVGLWVRPGRRSRAALRVVLAMLEALLQRWPVLLAVTRSAKRRANYAAFGVQFPAEPVPALYDGAPAWIGWLTAETFNRGAVRSEEVAA